AKFVMNGGTISNNIAYSSKFDNSPGLFGKGGGLFIDSDDVFLKKGVISDNYGESYGGGIYVNETYPDLHLDNVLFKKNKAEKVKGEDEKNIGYRHADGSGSAIWACPEGLFVIGDNSKVAFDGNSAERSIADIILYNTIDNSWYGEQILSGQRKSYVEEHFFRSIAENAVTSYKAAFFYRDETIYPTTSSNMVHPGDLGLVKDKEFKPIGYVWPQKDMVRLIATSTDVAEENYGLIIKNNLSRHGGGLATNGNLIMGGHDLSFEKKFENREGKEYNLENENDIKELEKHYKDLNLTFDLFVLDKESNEYEKVGEFNVNKDNKFQKEFTNLPLYDNNKYRLVFKEKAVVDFVVDYKAEKAIKEIKSYTEHVEFTVKDGKISMVAINKPGKYGKLEITKVLKGTETPVPGATFTLYKEVESEDGNTWEVVLANQVTNENGKLVFDQLDLGKYKVEEVKAAEGYILNTEAISFTVTGDGAVVENKVENAKYGKLEITKVLKGTETPV
ncbi:MAG: prealbumin-like fold domain-containing protein, partial [Tissierellia bacterium]|nr:prealbumin-like fold domain-containing protein [Tissierellia bacterium]